MSKAGFVENKLWHGHLAHAKKSIQTWARYPCHGDPAMATLGINCCHLANKKLLLLAGLACLFLCMPLLAANPLVNLPQGDFACTVEVTPHDAPPTSDPDNPERKFSPLLKSIVITRIGNIRRDTNVLSDGSTSHLWSLVREGMGVSEATGPNGKGNIHVLVRELRGTEIPKLLHFDEASVAWITGKALDKKPAGSGDALHYAAKVVVRPERQISAGPTGTTTLPAESALHQAWIDPKTLLPLKFDDGDTLYVLKFSAPPAGPLVIPAHLQAELNRWKKAIGPHPPLFDDPAP